jgi:hypothetical protein
MHRSTLILLLIGGLIVVGLYAAGVSLGSREHKPMTIDGTAWFATPKAITIADLTDTAHCLAGESLHVRAGQACMLAIESTWSPRRRALFLSVSSGPVSAVVFGNGDHPERNVNADLQAGKTHQLPLDRGGATVSVRCAGPLDCVASVRSQP